jgi:hypothetical protein
MPRGSARIFRQGGLSPRHERDQSFLVPAGKSFRSRSRSFQKQILVPVPVKNILVPVPSGLGPLCPSLLSPPLAPPLVMTGLPVTGRSEIRTGTGSISGAGRQTVPGELSGGASGNQKELHD